MRLSKGFLSGFVAMVALGVSANASAALVSITGGVAENIDPNNQVLPQAGIGQNGGMLYNYSSQLNILANNVTLTLYDVGSESAWKDQIRLGNTSGPVLIDMDDFGAFKPGPTSQLHVPIQLVGSVTQNAGVANLSFWRVYNDVSKVPTLLVANGANPNNLGPGNWASIAMAYLDANSQIVAGPTNRILVMLDDSGLQSDDNHDDYVGYFVATPVPLPPAVWLLGSALLGLLGIGRRHAA